MALTLPALPHLGPRARKALRIAGFVLLGLFTFVIALQLTFPYDRVKARLEQELATKYIVNIGEVERGWIPGRVYFNRVQLQTRPTKPDDVITTMYIDQLEVDMEILPLLSGKASADIDASIGGGHIRGNVTVSKGATWISLSGANLQSQMLPMREALGLPMSGLVEFSFELMLPNETHKQTNKVTSNWQKAEGSAELSCPGGCVFGDGKTKLKTKLKNQRNQAFAADGIEFGRVNMTSLFAQVEIKAGNLTVVKFDTKSDDGTLFVDYAMELAPTFGESQVTGCLRFNGSQSLLKREPKTFSAISATGAFLGPDNLFHIKLTDKFKDMRRLAQPCGPAVSGKSMDNPGARPNLPSPVPAAEDPGRVETPSSTFTPPTIVVPDASVPNPPPGAAAPGLDQTPGVMPSPGPPAPGPDNPGSAAPPGHGSAEAIHGGGDRGALPPASASGVEAPR